MRISVIIPTYNRKKQALETLKTFCAQNHQEFEMIIIDQGPEAIKEAEIAALGLTFPVKYERLARPNLSKARNAGIRSAGGDILLFCDDDIDPGRFLIAKHLACYGDDMVGGVGGRVIGAGKRKEKLFFKSLFPMVGTFNPVDASLICNFHKKSRCEVKHVLGCNMSFRKAVVQKAGLFDESVGGTSNLEDTDMSFRIRKLGFKLIFEPDAIVRHLELTSGGCQADNFNEFIYWLYFTDTLFFLRYFKKVFIPFFMARLFVRLLTYVFLRKNAKIISHATKGFLDAAKRYSEEKK